MIETFFAGYPEPQKGSGWAWVSVQKSWVGGCSQSSWVALHIKHKPRQRGGQWALLWIATVDPGILQVFLRFKCNREAFSVPGAHFRGQ